MKILLVTEFFPPEKHGGGEMSAEELANTLHHQGIEVHVLTSTKTERPYKIHSTLKTGSPKTILGNIKRAIKLKSSINKQIEILDKQHNFDIIHYLNTTSMTGNKTKKTKIATINGYTNFCPKRNLYYKEKEVCHGCSLTKVGPCIASSKKLGRVDNPNYIKYNPLAWLLLYYKYKRANNYLKNIDYFIPISEFTKKQLLKNNIKEEQTFIIPNIVQPPKEESQFTLEKKGALITYIGPALGKHKGVDLLIKAFNNVKENATLIIVGDGPELKSLKELANENVLFIKKLEYSQIASLCKQSDIMVLPSLWPEPLARVSIESMYFEKPLIATAAGGTQDYIKNGTSGYIIASQQELQNKMELLIQNPTLRNYLGREGRKIYEEKLEKEKITTKLIETYKRITGNTDLSKE